MVKDMLSFNSKAAVEKGKNVLTLELAEIREISDIIFKKLEKKIQVIEAIEASVDAKMAALERLIQKAEYFRSPGSGANRHHEIIALKEKGLETLEIAEILDIPRGEVNLILDLHMQKN